MAALMREHDWSQSPLGCPAEWPQALRSVVGLMLESRVAMFVAWGPELGFLYNDPYIEVLGAKHPRALGRRFEDIWREIWPDIHPLIEAAMSGHAIYREDLPLLMNRQGHDEQTWFTFSYSPVRDDDGAVAGMFCACWDTTQKFHAERALRESNHTLERRVADALAERKVLADIVEATDAIVIVLDRQGRWLAYNRAAEAALGELFSIEPCIGQSMFETLAHLPEQQAAVVALWQRAFDGEDFVTVAEFGDPARARRSYQLKFGTLRDRDGAPAGAYQFVDDITDRLREQERLRRTEDALRHAQKLESLGQLTGGVAHDFNNLLQVIASGLSLIEKRGEATSSGRTLDGMRRAVKRGTDLTRHLLAFSRQQPVNPAPIDLEAELIGMREMLSRSLRGDLDVEMTFGPGLWPVEVDAGELELAVLNLCVNARDAMPGGGTITIGAENAPGFDVAGRRGDFVCLRIEDTGTGMSPEVQARAFEPFFTTKETGKGSGLGLAQVYGFVSQAGGDVRIESREGRGTAVKMLLPRTHAPAVQAGAAASAPSTAAAPISIEGSVLFVEDDPEVASLTGAMLRDLGLQVLHVGTAAAALDALARGQKIDIVFSDVMIPGGMSGLELAGEVRRRRPALPIVLTTALASWAVDARAIDIPLLPKPYGLEELAATLTAQLQRSR
ncbi:MAG: PAS domain-containing protein [Caldimonas sp.]